MVDILLVLNICLIHFILEVDFAINPYVVFGFVFSNQPPIRSRIHKRTTNITKRFM